MLLDAPYDGICEDRGWVSADVPEDRARHLLTEFCADEHGEQGARPIGPARLVHMRCVTAPELTGEDCHFELCDPSHADAVRFREFDATDTLPNPGRLQHALDAYQAAETYDQIERAAQAAGLDAFTLTAAARACGVHGPVFEHAVTVPTPVTLSELTLRVALAAPTADADTARAEAEQTGLQPLAYTRLAAWLGRPLAPETVTALTLPAYRRVYSPEQQAKLAELYTITDVDARRDALARIGLDERRAEYLAGLLGVTARA